jgi:hypothetical protein
VSNDEIVIEKGTWSNLQVWSIRNWLQWRSHIRKSDELSRAWDVAIRQPEFRYLRFHIWWIVEMECMPGSEFAIQLRKTSNFDQAIGRPELADTSHLQDRLEATFRICRILVATNQHSTKYPLGRVCFEFVIDLATCSLIHKFEGGWVR